MKAVGFAILLTMGALPLRAADPLVASTFLGSGSWGDDEGISAVALDAAGNVYVAGWVETGGIPVTSNAFQTTHGGGEYDAMVAKFDPSLSSLLACTYLGGTLKDSANAIAVAGDGNVYVAGFSSSPDFPTTPGVYSGALNAGSMDGYICVLDPQLTNVVRCTFIGGEGIDEIKAMVVTDDHVYVAGTAWYSNFPTTPGAHDRLLNGDGDAFVARMDHALSTLQAASMIGGHYDEEVYDLAVDMFGTMYIVGYSDSAPNLHTNTFPTSPGAYDRTWGNSSSVPLSDGFICRFASDASLLASTLIGGYFEEAVRGIDVGPGEDVFVTGLTGSGDFPVTPGAFATSNTSAKEAFVSRLTGDLSTLVASTYLGGSRDDRGLEIKVGPLGVYVAGWSRADDFPFTAGAYQEDNVGDEDVFISRFDPMLSHLLASSQIGSRENDGPNALLIGAAPDYPVYVGGATLYRFPTTPGAYDTSYGNYSKWEGFVSIWSQPAALVILGDGYDPGTGDFLLRWISNPGHHYSIQHMTDPSAPDVWTPLVEDLPATPPVNTLPVTVPPGAGFQCYRIGGDDGNP